MHRRRLLRSLTLAGLGVATGACGSRSRRRAAPDDAGSGDDAPSTAGPRHRDGDRRTRPGEVDEPPDATPPGGPEDADPDGADDAGADSAGEAGADGPAAEDPDGPGDEDAEASATDEEPADPAPGRVEVLCREAVGLRAARRDPARHRIGQLTLHHTAVRLDAVSQAPARLRRHQRYHMDQGWSDIAYHYAVDLAGNVYELRDPAIPGDTFTDYDTTGHLQVVCEGDFDQQRPPDALLAGLEDLVVGLAAAHGLAPARIGSHRQHVPSTTCPGHHLQQHLEALRAGVADRAPAPRVERRCGGWARRRVAEIEAS